jgi:hypothetical protein
MDLCVMEYKVLSSKHVNTIEGSGDRRIYSAERLRSLHIKVTCTVPVFIASYLSYSEITTLGLPKMRYFLKSSIFWDITSRSTLKAKRSFGGTCRLHLQTRRI